MHQTPSTPQPSRAPSAGPQTRAELDAVIIHRSELRNQLESVDDIRDEVAERLTNRDEPNKAELLTRLKALDDRSGRLEQQILEADNTIASALARGVSVSEQVET